MMYHFEMKIIYLIQMAIVKYVCENSIPFDVLSKYITYTGVCKFVSLAQNICIFQTA